MAEVERASDNNVARLYERMDVAAGRALVGQRAQFELLVVALLSGGHVLLEGVPGTAKTLMAKILALLVDARFQRIQFTPDMMPSDIVGTSVFDLQSSRFYLRKGPIFTQVLLADEINRAPAKTQSALLEAMEERQVTLDGQRNVLAFPFFVVATQNPVEYEGTYPLPEAQLDRFLFKILVPYPGTEAEIELLRRYDRGFDAHVLESTGIEPVLGAEELRRTMHEISQVTIGDDVLRYIAAIVEATRSSPDLALGASPRASIGLLRAGKTCAAIRGRAYITPDDVKTVASPVLRHRLILRPEAGIDGLTPDRVIERTLARVPVPR